MSPPDDAPAAPRLTYLIKRVELRERAEMADALRPHGLTLAQYTALSLLEGRAGLSSAQIARRQEVSPQAMGQLVVSLEAREMVRRIPDPQNRRILRLHLTDHGRAVLQDCHGVADVFERRMLAHFSPEQADAFRDAVRRASAALAG